MNPDAKLFTVLRNKECVGFLIPCAVGFKAYNADGQTLGLFADEHKAAQAIYERAAVN